MFQQVKSKSDDKNVDEYSQAIERIRITSKIRAIAESITDIESFCLSPNYLAHTETLAKKTEELSKGISNPYIESEYKEILEKVNLRRQNINNARTALERERQDKIYHEARLKSFDDTYLNSEKITNYVSLQNLWKLGVDAQDHDFGRLSYDQGTNTFKIAEPGYIDAMETSLAFVFRTINEPLTPTFIRRLHFLCCCDVSLADKMGSSSKSSDNNEGSMISSGGRCPLRTKTVTKEGLQEMASYDNLQAFTYSRAGKAIDLTPENIDDFLKNLQQTNSGETGIPFSASFEDLLKILSNIIDTYYQNIKSSTSDDAHILSIATLAKQIECRHFFRDGNLRVIRLLILKLLIENNLPLTCIKDPNIIDGHSSLQIAEVIKRGMEVYKNLECPRPLINQSP